MRKILKTDPSFNSEIVLSEVIKFFKDNIKVILTFILFGIFLGVISWKILGSLFTIEVLTPRDNLLFKNGKIFFKTNNIFIMDNREVDINSGFEICRENLPTNKYRNNEHSELNTIFYYKKNFLGVQIMSQNALRKECIRSLIFKKLKVINHDIEASFKYKIKEFPLLEFCIFSGLFFGLNLGITIALIKELNISLLKFKNDQI